MKNITYILILLTISSAVIAADVYIPAKNEAQPDQESLGGFTSTPMQPGGKWHVHDPDRPQPPVAEPKYDGSPVDAPEGAKILFDGKNLDNFKNQSWPVRDGVMTVGKHNQQSIESFGDMHLHLEWKIPVGIAGENQKQGNSGVFLMDRYEIQVLNCWANRTYADGMTGALYGQTPPKFNACKKPGEWQSYDIHFTAPVFKDKKLISPAIVTVYFNNVKIHDNVAFFGPTKWKKRTKYKEHGAKAPFTLQEHKNIVHFRNIWVVEKKKTDDEGQ